MLTSGLLPVSFPPHWRIQRAVEWKQGELFPQLPPCPPGSHTHCPGADGPFVTLHCVPRPLLCMLSHCGPAPDQGWLPAALTPPPGSRCPVFQNPPLSPATGRQDSPGLSFWPHELLYILQSPNTISSGMSLSLLNIHLSWFLHISFSFSTQHRDNHKVT